MGAIYRRELKSLFSGMIAPIFIAFIMLMTGIVSVSVNFSQQYPQFEYVIPSVAYVFFLVIPILTMRSFAEEKATKTDQLLYSLPISTVSVVAGKFFAMVTVHFCACVGMCIYPPVLSLYGDVYLTAAYLAIFAFFLMGCAFIAIGMFISTLSDSQVISAVLTLGLFFIMYQMTTFTAQIPDTAVVSFILFIALCVVAAMIVYMMTKSSVVASGIGAALVVIVSVLYFIDDQSESITLFAGSFAKMLDSINLYNRMGNFMYSMFDFTVVIYYLSVVVLFGFLTVQSFDKKRWN